MRELQGEIDVVFTQGNAHRRPRTVVWKHRDIGLRACWAMSRDAMLLAQGTRLGNFLGGICVMCSMASSCMAEGQQGEIDKRDLLHLGTTLLASIG
jgi:hypothetical protein